MIVDCHAHFEPRIRSTAAILAQMDAVGIAKVALIARVTDPPMVKKPGALMAVQRALMQRAWTRPIPALVDRTFHGSGGTWNPWYRKLFGRADVPLTILTRPDNASVADVVTAHPDRFFGWIFLNPTLPDWEQELARWRAVKGMVGIKVHPFWHRYSLERIHPVAAQAARCGLPLLLHLGFTAPRAVQALVAAHPTCTFILAHAGVPLYGDLWTLLSAYRNVAYDCAGHHVDARIIARLVRAVGPDRCLYGTDDPYGDDDADVRTKEIIERLPLPPVDCAKILGRNFLRLIGYDA